MKRTLLELGSGHAATSTAPTQSKAGPYKGAILRSVVAASIAALCLLLLWGGTGRLSGALRAGSTEWSDYLADHVSAREWRAGGDPYALTSSLIEEHEDHPYVLRWGQRNPHPPFYILLLSPLSLLPFTAARVVLMVVSATGIVVAMAVFLRGRGGPPWMALAALALPVVHYELYYGQTTWLMLLMFVLAWRSMSAGHPRRAGVYLGAAAAVKLFPILLLPVVVRKASRGAALWFAGSTVAFSALGALILGWDATWNWLTVASPTNLDVWGPSIGNLSIAGHLSRAFGGWSPIFGAVGAVIAGAMLWNRSFWVGVPWAILGSPIAWLNYGVLALPAFGEVSWPVAAGLLVALNAPVYAPIPLLVAIPFITVALMLLGFPLRGRRTVLAEAPPSDLRLDSETRIVIRLPEAEAAADKLIHLDEPTADRSMEPTKET